MTEISEDPQNQTEIEEQNSDFSGDEKKRKMYVGLDLGTLQSCILTKLSKPGTGEHHGVVVPTVVGYPEDGILAGILPGNSKMLHGEEAISNSPSFEACASVE